MIMIINFILIEVCIPICWLIGEPPSDLTDLRPYRVILYECLRSLQMYE